MAAPGTLKGGMLVQVPTPKEVSNKFYIVYEFPAGSRKFIAYQFDSLPQANATYGIREGQSANWNNRSQAWFDQAVTATGSAEEVIGLGGTWQMLTDNIIKEEAARAGVKDPTMIGAMLNDPEMQTIMLNAAVGDWSDEQIKAAQRKTNFWKKELYPGIENLYTETTEPEQAYKDYMRQVTPALQALGYEPGPDGTMKSTVANMLNKKIDSNVFVTQVPTFIRATQNAEFATVLNAWAERDLGRSIGFNDWFDLMAGESQPDIEQIAERATLEWVAQNQGTQLDIGAVQDIAAKTQLSAEEAQRAFSEFNQSILAIGDEALGRYGLSRDEILSASVGVAPTSGRTVDEIKLLVAKTAREQGLADDDKINFYVGFNPSGTPTRPGLQTLKPEGA